MDHPETHKGRFYWTPNMATTICKPSYDVMYICIKIDVPNFNTTII